MSIAAHIAYRPDDYAWAAAYARPTTGGTAPVTFPAEKLKIRVAVLLGGTWVDLSSRVLWEYRIAVERGRRPNQRRTTAAALALTFKNGDQALSPRNPAGPWYGLLRQNTPIRVYVNPGSGERLRFTGKIPSWQPKLRGHPNDRLLPVVAYGVRNRLERPNNPPLQSAQARYLGGVETLSYRSLEADAAPGRTPGPAGSGDLPDLARGGVFSDTVAGAVSIGAFSWAVEADVKFPLGNAVVGTDATALTWNSTGTVGAWRLVDDSSGVGIIYYTAADGAAHTVRSAVNGYDGLWHHYRVEAVQNGTGIDVVLKQDGTTILSTTLASSTLGGNTFWLVQDTNPAGGADRMPAVGHVAFHIDNTRGADSYAAFTGWAGETPAARFLRLCLEEGIDAVVDEGITDQILMGPQARRTLPQLLVDCEDAAEGLVDETVDGQLRLSTLRSRYNRERILTIDFAAGDILPPLAPADDDEQLRNRWTLDRPDGGERAVEKTTGPNNVNDPEDDVLGVGRYSDSGSVSLIDDDALTVSAGWRVHRDTVDEPRYPAVLVELAKSPDLIPQWLACDIGSRVVIAGAPADVGPDDPDEILEGYREVFDQVSWSLDLHLEPASVYRVATVSQTVGYGVAEPRVDCGASTLAAALAADASVTDDFEDGVAAWTPTAATFVSSPAAPGYMGALTGLLTVVGTPAQAYTRREIAVTAGQSYSASVWCWSAAGYASTLAAIDWYTGPGATGYLSTTAGSTTALAAATWEQRVATGTAPAGAAYAQFGPTLASNPPGGTLLAVDHVQWLSVFTVAITDDCTWSHAWGDYPVVIDGEDMLLTSAAAATGTYPAQTQVLSVLRGCNGTAIAHAAGAPVHVKNPIVLAR